MPDIVDFPGGLIIADRTDPQLIANTRSGGMSINGFEQIVSPLSQRWEWTITIPIFQSGHMRAMRSFLAQMQGRFNYARIRMCDMYRMNRREMGAVPPLVMGRSVPHSDNAYFSDDSGYGFATGTYDFAVNVAEGETSFKIDPGFVIQPGILFSINNWLYVTTQIDDAPATETERTVHFMPPLRGPVFIGDDLDFKPIVLWRLSSDGEGSANLRAGKFGTVTLNFVEPVGR